MESVDRVVIEDEFEAKRIVSEKEARSLLIHNKVWYSPLDKPPRLIVNTYFDYGNQLLKQGITCRLRYETEATRMTVKVPNGENSHIEYHMPVTSAIDNGRSFPARFYLPDELNNVLNVPSLWPVGRLIVRRYDIGLVYPGGILDEIEYPDGSKEWELEVEYNEGEEPPFESTAASKYQRLCYHLGLGESLRGVQRMSLSTGRRM